MSQLLPNVMGSFAEFERALIRERQREGIVLAKKRGVYKCRKRVLTPEQIAEIVAKVNNDKKAKKAKLARKYNVSRETIHRYLREAELVSPPLVPEPEAVSPTAPTKQKEVA